MYKKNVNRSKKIKCSIGVSHNNSLPFTLIHSQPLTDKKLISLWCCMVSMESAAQIAFAVAVGFVGGVSKIMDIENPQDVNVGIVIYTHTFFINLVQL